jgi:hypothetical protein
MLRKFLMASVLLVVIGSPGLAASDGDRLAGLWLRSETSSAGLTRSMSLRLLPNGTFELRWSAAPPGDDSGGFAIVTGYYRVTGSSSLVSEVENMVMCADTSSCVPDPTGAPPPGYGTLTKATFEITSGDELVINGLRWQRGD